MECFPSSTQRGACRPPLLDQPPILSPCGATCQVEPGLLPRRPATPEGMEAIDHLVGEPVMVVDGRIEEAPDNLQ